MTASQTTRANSSTHETALPTFMDHVHELKSRFFWVAICFAISSAIVYPYFNVIINALTKPLGDHELYYLTPAGGLSFVIKICLYLGVIGALPAIIYHLYNFIAPVMPRRNSRQVVTYTIASIILAMCGVLFAYFISLPAAVGFLVNFNINNVSAMLTVDSYLSFVISYLIAGAILFQLPLVMMIINSIHRLSPKQLMSYQRHNIVGSFVLAAVLSPTPDVVNQSLLALPMVVMYQVGVVLIWAKNRKRKSNPTTKATTSRRTAEPMMAHDQGALLSSIPVQMPIMGQLRSDATSKPQPSSPVARRSVDGFGVVKQNRVQPGRQSSPKPVVTSLPRVHAPLSASIAQSQTPAVKLVQRPATPIQPIRTAAAFQRSGASSPSRLSLGMVVTRRSQRQPAPQTSAYLARARRDPAVSPFAIAPRVTLVENH